MFLVQYALGVKREEMRKLEEIAQAEEQKLLDDEKALEEDAAKFDAFLKENDKNSVEAIKKYAFPVPQLRKAHCQSHLLFTGPKWKLKLSSRRSRRLKSSTF